MDNLRLTQTVQKGGCAAKVSAIELRKILAQVEFPPSHEELLLDGKYFDDAAIYKVAPEKALVQTLDFFTPIVDDPYRFGQIAACNAVSDVYAMGGKPVTAMAILTFPIATFENQVITQVLQGASDLLKQANCTFVGGHSIDDDTLKFGLSVTGIVHPDHVWSNQGAREGDCLILTKPLGTGTMTAALKRSEVSENDILEALDSMSRLNNIINFLPDNLLTQIHAATDITGFGLAGHSYQMAKASEKTFEFFIQKLPAMDRAQEFLEKSFLTKAHRTNREYVQEATQFVDTADWQKLLVFDPQTSGGLLLSVEPSKAHEICRMLEPFFPKTQIVGRVISPTSHTLRFY